MKPAVAVAWTGKLLPDLHSTPGRDLAITVLLDFRLRGGPTYRNDGIGFLHHNSGPPGNRGNPQAYRDMLAIAYGRLLKLKNAGLSAENAVLQAPLKDLEQDWGDGIFTADKWIGIVYPAVF